MPRTFCSDQSYEFLSYAHFLGLLVNPNHAGLKLKRAHTLLQLVVTKFEILGIMVLHDNYEIPLYRILLLTYYYSSCHQIRFDNIFVQKEHTVLFGYCFPLTVA